MYIFAVTPLWHHYQDKTVYSSESLSPATALYTNLKVQSVQSNAPEHALQQHHNSTYPDSTSSIQHHSQPNQVHHSSLLHPSSHPNSHQINHIAQNAQQQHQHLGHNNHQSVAATDSPEHILSSNQTPPPTASSTSVLDPIATISGYSAVSSHQQLLVQAHSGGGHAQNGYSSSGMYRTNSGRSTVTNDSVSTTVTSTEPEFPVSSMSSNHHGHHHHTSNGGGSNSLHQRRGSLQLWQFLVALLDEPTAR